MRQIRFLLIGILIFLSGCIQITRLEGDYTGKVIDAETNEPIEGVVVLMKWSNVYLDVGGSHSFYYDAKETLTDKKGEFRIPGLGLSFFSYVGYPSITAFKASYSYFNDIWPGLKNNPYVKVKGNRVTIYLKKLTMAERKKQGTPDFYIGEEFNKEENRILCCLPKNINLLPNEINKELLEQGLKPYVLEVGRCEK